jgi:hypothetical protein
VRTQALIIGIAVTCSNAAPAPAQEPKPGKKSGGKSAGKSESAPAAKSGEPPSDKDLEKRVAELERALRELSASGSAPAGNPAAGGLQQGPGAHGHPDSR